MAIFENPWMKRCALLALTLVVGAVVLPAQQRTPASTAQQVLEQNEKQRQQDAEVRALADHAQRVQDLIGRVEAGYRSGVDNYNANHLDAARQDFDTAVDAMLSSGLDLKNDPLLADEFDQLLSRINSLELQALKQGNGFSPKMEAAPLDAAEDITFKPDPVLAGKVTAELKTTTSDLPLVENEYVTGWIDAFTNKPARRATLKRSLERAGKYKQMILKILRDNGVPQDLIYQAVAESGFQPQVVNRRSGAGGMWQFMPFGDYGLARNGYFDERFDPEKSTVAYAKYMKTLYNQFGDWYLAMAAYDWGPGRVQRAVSRTGYADYWELYRRADLPAETKAYVPGIIAAIIMAKNPEQYGLTDLTPDAAVVSETVTTEYAIDLRLVADLTDATVNEIVALNPALLRLATPGDIPYDLHLPVGKKAVYLERLKDIPERNRASWRFHVVKNGETLEEIAGNLHARASEIATYNELKPSETLSAGDSLIVPIAASAAVHGQLRYTVRRGDTLVTVADRYGVSVEDLREWNKLKSNKVTPGRSLYVAEPVRLAPSVRGRRGDGSASTRTSRGRYGTARKSSPRASHATGGAAKKKKR